LARRPSRRGLRRCDHLSRFSGFNWNPRSESSSARLAELTASQEPRRGGRWLCPPQGGPCAASIRERRDWRLRRAAVSRLAPPNAANRRVQDAGAVGPRRSDDSGLCRHRRGRVPVSPGSPVPRDPPGDLGTVLRPSRRAGRGAGPYRRVDGQRGSGAWFSSPARLNQRGSR